MESVFAAIGLISIISVVNVADALASASGVEATTLGASGSSLVKTYEWGFQWGPGLVAGIGNGLMLGYLMYRSALVPPRMALLGLIGGPVLILNFVLKLCDVYEDGWGLSGLLTLPSAAWELSRASTAHGRGSGPRARSPDQKWRWLIRADAAPRGPIRCGVDTLANALNDAALDRGRLRPQRRARGASQNRRPPGLPAPAPNSRSRVLHIETLYHAAQPFRTALLRPLWSVA